jgi:trypsin
LEAVEDRHSYAVSLQGPQGHFCGGFLIARDVILTAAHCQGMAIKVMLGRHNLEENYDGGEFKVRWERPFPEYDKALTDNDFMLVFLHLG